MAVVKMACGAASCVARESLDLNDEPGSALRKSGVGPGFRLRLRGFRRFVAWIKRSKIRERRSGSVAAPGFRSAQPGLRKKGRKRNAGKRRVTTAASCDAARATATDVLGELAAKSDRARKVHDSYMAFRDKISAWSRISIQAVLEARAG